MLVVLAIITIVSAIVFSSQTSFNSTVLLSDAVYDVALTVRNVENFGTGSESVGSNLLSIGYGVHFDTRTPSTFLTFADTNPGAGSGCHPLPANGASAPDAHPGDCVLLQSGGSADAAAGIRTYTLGNNVTLSALCTFVSAWTCSTGAGTLLSPPVVDITSVRPNTVITIVQQGSFSAGNTASEACLAFTSPRGGTRYLDIKQSGLITPQQTSCAPGNI